MTEIVMPSAAAILARLTQLARLPLDGFLAGGAVANTILSLLDGRDYPVNDLDVFIKKEPRPLSDQDIFNDDSADDSRSSTNDCWPEEISIAGGAAVHDSGDSYSPSELRFQKKYRVMNSRRAGPLNTIEIVGEETEGITIAMLLDAFDLNACQAGIDLASGELVITNAFSDFIRHRQLIVHDVTTPFRSAVRLLSKHADLGCYCNLDEEFAMLASANVNFSDGRLAVSGELAKKLLCYRQQLQQFLNIEAEQGGSNRFFLSFKEKHVRSSISALLDNTGTVLAGSAFFRRAWNALERSQTPLAQRRAAMALVSSRHCALGVALLDNFAGTQVSSKRLSRIEKFMHGHSPELFPQLGKNFNEVYRSVKTLEALGETGMIAVGGMERKKFSFPLPLEPEIIKKQVVAYLEELGAEQLARPLMVPGWLFPKKAVVRELLTAAELVQEGVRMRHCVGGYASEVRDGISRIFHVDYDGRHSTVQYYVTASYPGPPCIVQQRGRLNASVSPEETAIAKRLEAFMAARYFQQRPLEYLTRATAALTSKTRQKLWGLKRSLFGRFRQNQQPATSPWLVDSDYPF